MTGWPRSPALKDTFKHFSWTLLRLPPSSHFFLSLISCTSYRSLASLYLCHSLPHPLSTAHSIGLIMIRCVVIPAITLNIISDDELHDILDHGTALSPQRPLFRFSFTPSSSRKRTKTCGWIGWKQYQQLSLPRRTLRHNRHHQRSSRTSNPFGRF